MLWFYFKVMDQPGHVARFLPYQRFNLCILVSIKNKIGNSVTENLQN